MLSLAEKQKGSQPAQVLRRGAEMTTSSTQAAIAAARRAQAAALRAQADALRAQADAIEAEAAAIEQTAGDELIPLAQAAKMLGTSLRALKLGAKRGELTIEGPRSARVIRRAEWDRYLSSRRVMPVERDTCASSAAVPPASLQAAVDRMARGGR